MKITINGMKLRHSCSRCKTVTSFNDNNIGQSYKTRMYEKEINLIGVYLPQKTSFQGMCSTGSQNAQNRLQWGMSLAICPRIFRLLGHWPTCQKFQNDHCEINYNYPRCKQKNSVINTCLKPV